MVNSTSFGNYLSGRVPVQASVLPERFRNPEYWRDASVRKAAESIPINFSSKGPRVIPQSANVPAANLAGSARFSGQSAVNGVRGIFDEMVKPGPIAQIGMKEAGLLAAGYFGNEYMSTAAMLPRVISNVRNKEYGQAGLNLFAGWASGSKSTSMKLLGFTALVMSEYLGRAEKKGITEGQALGGLAGAAKEEAGEIVGGVKKAAGHAPQTVNGIDPSGGYSRISDTNAGRAGVGTALKNSTVKTSPATVRDNLRVMPKPLIDRAA